MQQQEFKKIVIVGGGTSGWMAAIAIAAHFPEKQITVIDPAGISPIGVGESVTGAVQQFVNYPPHGLSMSEFFRRTDATLKLGIWYKDWRRPGDEYLTPIDAPVKFFDHSYYEDIEDFYALATSEGQSLGEIQTHGKLMRAGKTDYFRRPDDGRITGDWSMASCHFDALKFSAWLKDVSRQRPNIVHVDDVMQRFEQDAESGLVTKIVTEAGREIAGDFFLDCTGFRRLLFEQAYGPKWIDFAKHIKVDSAIPSLVDYAAGQEVPVYTVATALKHGWKWAVPTQSRLGTGYLFSSRYVSDEEALAELRSTGVAVEEHPSIIRFRSGKLESQWTGNVCAIGLAGGFIEALEATTIHIMYVQIKALAELFLPFYSREASPVLSRQFNQMMNTMYDDFVDFVSFHYHAGRSDTEFWQDYQKEGAITPRNRERREKWAFAYPLREDFTPSPTNRCFMTTGIMVWMPMLCALGCLHQHTAAALLSRSKYLEQGRRNATKYVAVREAICRGAISQQEAISFLRDESFPGTSEAYVGASV